MAFTLAPGETVQYDQTVRGKGGGLFFTPSFGIRVTNFRFAVTESLKRGSETTKYVPLEQILYVQEGRYSKPRFLWASIACFILGIPLLFLFFIGIAFFIVGVGLFGWYLMSKAQTLLVHSGGEAIELALEGASDNIIQRIVENLEEARLERTNP